MLVRFKQSIASQAWAYNPGDEADLDPEIALPWIDAGICEVISPPPESAMLQGAAERAVKPEPKHKGK